MTSDANGTPPLPSIPSIEVNGLHGDEHKEGQEQESDGLDKGSTGLTKDTADEIAEPTKKKKKKKKSKGKGGKTNPRPTGFEDDFAEAPLTVKEFEEDLLLYDPRIETCIQKYKARRKFDAERNQLFEGYLSLGGVSVGQKKFSGGLDIKPNDDRDAEEIAQFTATDYVDSKLSKVGKITELDDEEDLQDGGYAVDFNYIVRGFLSYKVPFVYCLRKVEDLTRAVKTIHNFLNFVIYHNVCPEFKENIEEAIATCNTAARELPLCSCVSARFPGEFNKACSTLFGGFYQNLLSNEQSWDDVKHGTANPVLRKDDVMKTFDDGLAYFGSKEQIEASVNAQVVHKEFASLRVIRLEFPPEGTAFNTLGKLHVNVWTPEDQKPIESKWSDTEGFHIMLEKQNLQYCFVGMCFDCTIRELDNGLIFLDEVTAVMTSFFLELREEKEADVDSDDFDFD